jgi:hypothetical protein
MVQKVSLRLDHFLYFDTKSYKRPHSKTFEVSLSGGPTHPIFKELKCYEFSTISSNSYQRSATGRPGSGGASKAMFSGNHPAHSQIQRSERSYVVWSSVIHGKGKRQVEVAVIKSAIPSHANLMATHQSRDRPWVEGFSEKLQIILLILFPDQLCPKTSQRHIGNGEKASKSDAKALTQLAPVIFFKNQLWGREKWSSRVVDKVQRQLRVRSIAQDIQSLDGRYTSLIDSFTPLSAHVLFKVTRHGCHELNLVVPEELGQTFHAPFQKHSQVRSHLDSVTFLAENLYKTPEIRVELGGSSGQVDKFGMHAFSRPQNQLHGLPFHHLLSLGGCLEVTMGALLIAPESQIHLQSFDLQTIQSVVAHTGDLFFEIIHPYSSHASLFSILDKSARRLPLMDP